MHKLIMRTQNTTM